MSAVLTGNAAPHLKCGRKSGLISGMSCDVNPVEGRWDFGYRQKKKRGFSEPASLTRRPKGSKLSEAMTRKPESKGFFGKAGFEKRCPAERLGFFVGRKKEAAREFRKCFPNTSLIL
jgi:hypothetical protein